VSRLEVIEAAFFVLPGKLSLQKRYIGGIIRAIMEANSGEKAVSVYWRNS